MTEAITPDADWLQPQALDAARSLPARCYDEVQREDSAICEAVQRGLASGSFEAGRLNPLREQGVWHFHERLRAAYRGADAATIAASVGGAQP